MLSPFNALDEEPVRRRDEWAEDDRIAREWLGPDANDPRGCTVTTADGRVLTVEGADDMHDASSPWGTRWTGSFTDGTVFCVVGGVAFDDATGERIGELQRKGRK